jgi:xylan 1,4-beta-xylosidase
MESRREALKLALLGGLSATGSLLQARVPPQGRSEERAFRDQSPRWGRGIEGQRIADLGDGRYLNPIMAGDHPDPTVLKDGDTYYMTFSSFDSSPGLIIWRSYDLVNWHPLGAALSKSLGLVFAVDLCKHNGRYFIYIPIMHTAATTAFDGQSKIFVIYADDMAGPWSEPMALAISDYIDPCHIVGEDGKRYLFLSGVSRVQLSDDGLAVAGPIEHVYDGWKYPDDWIVEAFALEGPKLLRHGGWFYLISAVGGTAGPPTGHMVIAARSRSIHGPWINCPQNPIVRTKSASEPWWSRGHATLVEGPAGDWWMIYHGFENGYRTLGRQTLLEPVEWTPGGWPRAAGGDLAQPVAKPAGGRHSEHGIALSDDFAARAFGVRWCLFKARPDEWQRVRLERGALVLSAAGSSPSDTSPLTNLCGDRSYEVSVHLELSGGAQGGLLLFYSNRLYCGMGHDGRALSTYRSGELSFWREPAPALRRLFLRIVNYEHVVTMYYSENGADWTRHGLRIETSGYNTNTIDDLLSLRPALFAVGRGEVRFRNFAYHALR